MYIPKEVRSGKLSNRAAPRRYLGMASNKKAFAVLEDLTGTITECTTLRFCNDDGSNTSKMFDDVIELEI